MAESAGKLAGKHKDFVEYLNALIAVGDEALAKTPELLPVLKKAGVVDSGGVGLKNGWKNTRSFPLPRIAW